MDLDALSKTIEQNRDIRKHQDCALGTAQLHLRGEGRQGRQAQPSAGHGRFRWFDNKSDERMISNILRRETSAPTFGCRPRY